MYRFSLLFFLLFSFYIQTADFISATVEIPAVGFLSLEKALKSSLKISPLSNLTLQPISPSQYHMTIFDLTINFKKPRLTNKEKSLLKHKVETALHKAATKEIKKTLAHLRKMNGNIPQPILLPFKHLEIFKKKVVGVFQSTRLLTTLINNIENSFNALVSDPLIASVKRQQQTIKPHVSVARITSLPHTYFGCTLNPTRQVADFHITHAGNRVNVQWR